MDKQQANNLALGLSGVFRGFINIFQIAVEMVASGLDDITSSGGPGRHRMMGSRKGVHAVYGVSLRVGAKGALTVARFGNVRQNERKEPVVDEEREPMIDVLDEDDYYLVIAELPGVGQAAIDWNICDNQMLAIRAESGDRKYSGRLQLRHPVQQQAAMSHYENGVLQLKLWKQPR